MTLVAEAVGNSVCIFFCVVDFACLCFSLLCSCICKADKSHNIVVHLIQLT